VGIQDNQSGKTRHARGKTANPVYFRGISRSVTPVRIDRDTGREN
jgi:hypothetical protein